MIYLKLFQTEQERQACTEKQEYVSYTIESDKVNIMNLPFFCKLALNNGDVVEIEGSGELTSAMTSQYKTTTVSAEIGELCTSIGYGAFSSCTELTNITIENGTIGQFAFANCTSLTTVTLGDGVTSIANYAFVVCNKLSTVSLGNGVINIGSYAFNGCTELTNITIENGTIWQSAFQGCNKLTTVSLGNGVTNIYDGAFANCTSLTTVSLGNGITSIGNGGFAYCNALSSISCLATTAPTIQSQTFLNINSNGTLYVPSGSSGYDTWLSSLPSGWTKVEQ